VKFHFEKNHRPFFKQNKVNLSKLSLWLSSDVSRLVDIWGEWRYSSTILHLGTSWGVSGKLHAPAALPPGKAPSCLSDSMLNGPKNWSGRRGEKNFLPLPGIELRPSRP
jgi:hypothetical protein